jgi:hypothetical protein
MSFLTRLGLLALFTALASVPALASSEAGAETPKPSVVRHLSGAIEVSPEGAVESVELDAKGIRPTLVKRIESAVREWRFNPYLVDGQPRRIRTSMNLKLEQFDGPGGSRVMLSATAFGTPRMTSARAPVYPINHLERRREADVQLLLTVEDDGSVSDVQPLKGRVYGMRPAANERAHRANLNSFMRSAANAAREWTFDFLEPVNTGEKRQMIVPISFRLTGTNDSTPRSGPPMVEYEAVSEFRTRVAEAEARRAAIGDATAALSLREGLTRLDGDKEVEL